MSKPLIGVMPLWDEGKKSIWMLQVIWKESEKQGEHL